MDRDGIRNEVDPDVDSDGVGNELDSSPFGVGTVWETATEGSSSGLEKSGVGGLVLDSATRISDSANNFTVDGGTLTLSSETHGDVMVIPGTTVGNTGSTHTIVDASGVLGTDSSISGVTTVSGSFRLGESIGSLSGVSGLVFELGPVD